MLWTGPKRDARSVAHRTEPRKPDTEGHTYESPDRNRPEWAPPQKQPAGWWLSGAGEGRRETAGGLGCSLEGRRWGPQGCWWRYNMGHGQRENWSFTVKRLVLCRVNFMSITQFFDVSVCKCACVCVCRRVCPSFGDAHERPGLGRGTISRGAGASLQSWAIMHVSGRRAGPQTVPGVARPPEAVPGHAPILEDQAWRARPSADLHSSFGVFVGTHILSPAPGSPSISSALEQSACPLHTDLLPPGCTQTTVSPKAATKRARASLHVRASLLGE